MLGLRKEKRRRPEAPAPLYCSFCNKGEADVRKLIAGPTVMICDECVNVCVDIIVDDARVSGSAADLQLSLEDQAKLRAQRMNAQHPPEPVATDTIPDWHVRCGLCHLVVPTENAILVPNRGILCEPCVAAVQAAATRLVRSNQEKDHQ